VYAGQTEFVVIAESQITITSTDATWLDTPRVLWRRANPEEIRREKLRRELEAYLDLLDRRRRRHAELVRALKLSRRDRPTKARPPSQTPKARSTSGAQRWRVRNPNL